ncbi:SDR family NAD(P)-dependent oxidoreductase [Nocardiopsis sp. FIRDI 009]|uniref:SDR family NAD(P)-dependent oxidoreductase n=1 Tax=Nocardiopsis sp. FIRDI 009 TaxID=714197 RepID=UPI000E261087|nr:SDR family oxidoreductase [Nocardiopsis sp. FIRDI 009]
MTTTERTGADRLAVVTGASGTLGSKLAESLLSRGWHVELWSRSQNDAIKRLTEDHPDTARWGEVDVTDHGSVTRAVRAIPRSARLELLINNAGALNQGLFTMEPPATSEQMIQVNLVGALHASKACARVMLGRGGSIVNISSINAVRGHRGVASYSAAKAGLHGLTASLARELGADGIRVNTIVPGYFESDLSSRVTPENLQRITRRTPLGRLGTPEDVVSAVEYLISPGADFVTGQCLTIDGGLTC